MLVSPLERLFQLSAALLLKTKCSYWLLVYLGTRSDRDNSVSSCRRFYGLSDDDEDMATCERTSSYVVRQTCARLDGSEQVSHTSRTVSMIVSSPVTVRGQLHVPKAAFTCTSTNVDYLIRIN